MSNTINDLIAFFATTTIPPNTNKKARAKFTAKICEVFELDKMSVEYRHLMHLGNYIYANKNLFKRAKATNIDIENINNNNNN